MHNHDTFKLVERLGTLGGFYRLPVPLLLTMMMMMMMMIMMIMMMMMMIMMMMIMMMIMMMMMMMLNGLQQKCYKTCSRQTN
jgi:hypothetical protein